MHLTSGGSLKEVATTGESTRKVVDQAVSVDENRLTSGDIKQVHEALAVEQAQLRGFRDQAGQPFWHADQAETLSNGIEFRGQFDREYKGGMIAQRQFFSQLKRASEANGAILINSPDQLLGHLISSTPGASLTFAAQRVKATCNRRPATASIVVPNGQMMRLDCYRQQSRLIRVYGAA